MTTIAVDGMSCGHCERAVEDAARAVSGVTAATADREAGQVRVEGHPDPGVLVRAIEDAGYDARA